MDASGVFAGLNPEQRARGRGRARARLHPRRRRLRQDDDDHAPHRQPGRDGRVLAVADPRGHVHRQGGRRDARPASPLGVARRRARTFHAAALAQLRHFVGEPAGPVLPSKALRSQQIAALAPAAVPLPAARRPREPRSSGRRTAGSRPTRYLERRSASTSRRSRPTSWQASSARYERRKDARAGSTSRTCSSSPSACTTKTTARASVPRALPRVHGRRVPGREPPPADSARRWLGERDDLCVVGDDYQSIYSFTGATPRYLLDDAKAVPGRDVVRLEDELPLDAADPRAREPARAAARGGREGAARRRGRRARNRSLRPFEPREAEIALVVERIARSPARASRSRRWRSSTGSTPVGGLRGGSLATPVSPIR